VTGCSIWTHEANKAANNGVFYGWTSESDCMAACLMSPTCVAVDVGPLGCVIHNNVDDLMFVYNASDVTQFVLDRHCLRTSVRLMTKTATLAPENFTTSTGILLQKLHI